MYFCGVGVQRQETMGTGTGVGGGSGWGWVGGGSIQCWEDLCMLATCGRICAYGLDLREA